MKNINTFLYKRPQRQDFKRLGSSVNIDAAYIKALEDYSLKLEEKVKESKLIKKNKSLTGRVLHLEKRLKTKGKLVRHYEKLMDQYSTKIKELEELLRIERQHKKTDSPF